VRKDKFKDFPSVPEDLDLVEEEDQFTHLLTLDEVTEGQDILSKFSPILYAQVYGIARGSLCFVFSTLDVFKLDEEYVVNEEKYATLRKEILDDSDDEEGGEDADGDSDDEEAEEGEGEDKDKIFDKTETNMVR
jgi:pre-mRNA-splicing factor CWC22